MARAGNMTINVVLDTPRTPAQLRDEIHALKTQLAQLKDENQSLRYNRDGWRRNCQLISNDRDDLKEQVQTLNDTLNSLAATRTTLSEAELKDQIRSLRSDLQIWKDRSKGADEFAKSAQAERDNAVAENKRLSAEIERLSMALTRIWSIARDTGQDASDGENAQSPAQFVGRPVY